ncbi:MAG: Hint domain-containing protein [Gemmatimonadaceae bacterium]
MPTLPGIPAAGSVASIIRACQRLNPCMELDVDILAVARAAQASTKADWDAGTKTNVTADANSGALSLTQTGTSSIFSQTNTATVRHAFHDAVDGSEEYALDFFFNPNIAQGVAIELASIDLYLATFGATGSSFTFDKNGIFRVRLGYYDVDWNLVPIGDPFDVKANAAGITPGGGVYTIDFTSQTQRRFIIHPGFQNTNTGLGYDGSALRNPNIDSKGVCHIINMPRGLSISVEPVGRGFQGAWIGCVANATAAQFDTTAFYRRATNRNCGPYNPTLQPFAANDLTHNPDDRLIAGAVPGYGAKAVTNGSWGIARRPTTKQRAQDSGGTWEQPYHNLKAKTFAASGSWVGVLSMGGVPTHDLEVRLDDWQPIGTSITYSLEGSNVSAAGPWTSIGAVKDGTILVNGNYFIWYRLTASFTAGPASGTRFATPSLQAWMMVERVTLNTYRYLKDFDSTVTADPVTGQSSIGELKLPILKAGRKDYRDLASLLGSSYAPSSLEAHVYARNTRDGTRLFLNSYRLENRDPQDGTEEMTFVSGFDRLSVKIPSAVETYRYPLSGTVAATTVALVSGTTYRVTPSTSGSHPFTGQSLVGFRAHGVTGNAAGIDYVIVANNNDHFDINADPNLQTVPVNGDTFEIHSDVTTRTGAAYVGQDYAAIYSDLLGVQSAVPARYRGILPPTTGRTGTFTLPSDGVKALDIIQDVALHADGIITWERGRIDFADIYSPNKVSVATWDDRHIVSLETPIGADRRMPSVRVKYGYQADTQKFTNQATYEAFDELTGWGRPNLFDVFEFPDNFCRWNDLAEANYSADKFQRAWKSGVRLWKVKTVLMWPWLKMGDAVTILTDQYTDRRLSFSADGLTDNGMPISGRVSAVGVIVGKNLWGTDFIVAIRGLDAISGVGQSGAVSTTGMPVVFKPPVPTITPSATEADDTTRTLTLNAVAGSGGGGTNLTWAIYVKISNSAETLLNSGDGTSFAYAQVVNRDLRSTKLIRFRVTDTITGLFSEIHTSVPSQRQEIDTTGHVKRGRPFDDGDYGGRSTTNDGLTSHSSHVDSRGYALNTHFNTSHHIFDDVPEGSTYKRTTANEKTGGSRGFTQLHSSGYLDGAFRHAPSAIAGAWSAQVISNANRGSPTPVSSSGTTISIGAWSLVVGDTGNNEKVVDYGSGTCTQNATGKNYIYTDDITIAGGGSPTYFALIEPNYLPNQQAHLYVGQIVTSGGSGTGSGTGGPTCVAPETLILVCDRHGKHLHEKRADQIEVGDYVWTIPEFRQDHFGAFRVKAASAYLMEARTKIWFEDGRHIVCSAKHRLKLAGADAWRQAQTLFPGQVLMGSPRARVEHVIRSWDLGPVVKLTVEKAQTFIAAGILNHNIKPV